MRKFGIVILLLLVLPLCLAAQDERFSSLDSLMTVYCQSMQLEPLDVKQRECDFMISSARDSLAREHIARKLFEYYVSSPLMGEESVALYLYDKWFASGLLSIGGEFVSMDAEIFATFNRNNLLGMDAPVLMMEGRCGRKSRIPSEGRTSILFFFDLGCPKCRVDIDLMPSAVSDVDFPVDFFAVYCGSDKKAWDKFRRTFSLDNERIRVIHLWDPDMDTDYQRMYGVVSTPKLFVVEPSGTIIGRRLEPDSLKELLVYAGAVSTVYDEFNKSE